MVDDPAVEEALNGIETAYEYCKQADMSNEETLFRNLYDQVAKNAPDEIDEEKLI